MYFVCILYVFLKCQKNSKSLSLKIHTKYIEKKLPFFQIHIKYMRHKFKYIQNTYKIHVLKYIQNTLISKYIQNTYKIHEQIHIKYI